MELVTACCLILITIALWGGAIFVILAAVQVRRTAQALEVKVYEVGDDLDRLRDVASAAGNLAGIFRSPWVKGLGLALGAATTYYTLRSRPQAATAEAACGKDGRDESGSDING